MDTKDNQRWSQILWDPLEEEIESPLRSQKEGIRVAAYCRISKGTNNINSLENQVSYFSNLIYERKNWKFIGVYIDDKISGATVINRPGFQRMLRHAQEGKIDLILTKSVARFSRNAKDILEVIQALKDTKTTIYFEGENIEVTGGRSSLMLETHAAMAQEFIEGLSNLVKFSYRKRINEGRPYFTDMYGYDYKEQGRKDMVKINEEEARVVQWIFREFISGRSYSQISRTLNKMDVKTKKGKSQWNGVAVGNILKRVEYTGNKIALKRSKNLLDGKVNDHENHHDRFQILNTHPAIISNEIYEKAQERVDEVSVVHSNKMVYKKSILRDRLTCGRCGAKFTKKGAYSFQCAFSEPSVSLCDAEKVKAFDPQGMILKGLFSRMMSLEIEVKKSSKKITYELHDHFNRTDKELRNEFSKMYRKLRIMLVKANENEYLEFQRLMIFTNLEIARAKEELDEINRLKKKYAEFEDRAYKVEEDHEYRLSALTWMDSVYSIETFITSSTTELIKVWMSHLTIYSKSVFAIEWIDEEITVIGNEEITDINNQVSVNNQMRLEDTEKQKNRNKKFFENPLVPYESIESPKNKSSELNTSGMEESMEKSNSFAKHINTNGDVGTNPDVIKLEDGLSINDLDNLKKNILKNKYKILQQNENRKLRVAAYCRVSTHLEEQKLSLQTQLAYYNFKILSTPKWEFAGIYADEGLSGTETEHREEFNRMLDDARKGKINMIITKSVSRLSRNVQDVLETVKFLNQLEPNVSIYFEKEQIRTDDPHATMLLSLMAVVAQNEVESLSNSISWGIQNLAKRGEITRGLNNYGYVTHKDRTWEIIDEEAEVVRFIFGEFVNGVNINGIIKELYKKKIKSPKDNEYWDYNTLRNILKNEKYIGDYEFQKYYTPNVIGEKCRINKGQEPKYYIEKHHEAIISKELFEGAQQSFQLNQKEITNGEKNDGTAGRECYYKTLTCSKCGSLITRYKSDTYGSSEGSQWRCIHSFGGFGSDCNAKMVPERYLDYNFLMVLQAIRKERDFAEEVQKHLDKSALSSEQQIEMDMLGEQMKKKNQELYDAVNMELQKEGRNTNLINQLTNDIIELRNRYQVLVIRLEQLQEDRTRLEKLMKYCEKTDFLTFKQFHHMRPRIKAGESLYLTTKAARTSSYMDMEGQDNFQVKIFTEFVLSARMDTEGRIRYKFAEGLEFEVELTHENYKELMLDEKEKIHQEELLISKEVREIKEFCWVGRSPKEIRDHLGITSECSFDKRIKKPLFESGHLQLIEGAYINQRKYIWNSGKE